MCTDIYPYTQHFRYMGIWAYGHMGIWVYGYMVYVCVCVCVCVNTLGIANLVVVYFPALELLKIRSLEGVLRILEELLRIFSTLLKNT